MKNLNVRPFFSCFFIARANQKIRILALGRHSSVLDYNSGRYLVKNPFVDRPHTTHF
jgi:hypothetical protein